MNNQNELHRAFISRLEIRYGKFNSEKNRFESTSNSKIARDLFYSDSQFSRLINNTASEGELVRAVNNIQRLLDVHSLEKEVEKYKSTQYRKRPGKIWWIVLVFLMILTGILGYLLLTSGEKGPAAAGTDHSRYEMLQWSFENNYIRPYITLKELPDDCYFPCYKYQGKWTLEKEYKIPFFRERNGFHYVAKQAVMYATCGDKNTTNGEKFEGYEYQKHEIWYDKREFPIDSFLVKGSLSRVRSSYNKAALEDNSNFVKVAYVHTFFKTEFEIDSLDIQRTGKTIGRDIELIDDGELMEKLSSAKLMEELKSEVNAIARNRLEDFSKPIKCNPIRAPKEDFNMIEEGDRLSFDCQFSTGRFLVNYNKVYVLDDQYINNYCR